jgi:hypothetical protein
MSFQSENPISVRPANPGTQTSTMSIISLVMGVLGWTALPVIGGIVAVVCGYIARNEIKKSSGLYTGDGLAVAGLVLGYANVIFACLFGILWVAIVAYTLSQR